MQQQQYSRRSNGVRKTHRKSRNGCLQCKKRHIKCDEQQPVCGDCQRLETACSLSENGAGIPSPSISSPSNSTHSPAGPITPRVVAPLPVPEPVPVPVPVSASVNSPHNDAQVCMLDLELLYHYINSTVQSFITSDSKTLIHLATHEYVQVGFQHPFVMHTMLACSALHMYSKDRSRTALLGKATSLQQVALRGVHPYVSNLQVEYAIPAFIFSSYTGMFTFAELVLSPDPPQDAIEDMLNCFKILRGTETIVRPFTEYLMTTWMRPALVWDEYLTAVNVPAEQRVPTQDRIMELVDSLDVSVRSAVSGGVDQLFSFIHLFLGTPVKTTSAPSPFVQGWPVLIEQPLIELCQRREPLGLIILAHYAALMALRPGVWWYKGWPTQLFSAVEYALAGRLGHLMFWPRDIVRQAAE